MTAARHTDLAQMDRRVFTEACHDTARRLSSSATRATPRSAA